MNEPNRTLKQRAYQELKEYLAITLYLWLVFGLFILYKSVLLSERGFSLVAHGIALFNALALGKIMLVARAFHFADYFKEKPLVYPTLLSRSLSPLCWVVSKFSRKLRLAGITANPLVKALRRLAQERWAEYSPWWRFWQFF